MEWAVMIIPRSNIPTIVTRKAQQLNISRGVYDTTGTPKPRLPMPREHTKVARPLILLLVLHRQVTSSVPTFPYAYLIMNIFADTYNFLAADPEIGNIPHLPRDVPLRELENEQTVPLVGFTAYHQGQHIHHTHALGDVLEAFGRFLHTQRG
jgi:hypothetical protein